jgi:hypothetical protein
VAAPKSSQVAELDRVRADLESALGD